MKPTLQSRTILLGVTGSISAYKSTLIARECIKHGAKVRVVMTEAATKFIPTLTLENLTKAPVVCDMFDVRSQNNGSWHIHLAHECDIFVIAPCSATTLGKIAHGICDSTVSALALALPPSKPCIITPAMDTDMWTHPATQRNVRIIQDYGNYVMQPESGELASGIVGQGRLPEPENIVQYISEILSSLPDNYQRYTNDDTSIDDGMYHGTSSSAFEVFEPEVVEGEVVEQNIEEVQEEQQVPSVQEPLHKRYGHETTVPTNKERDTFQAELELQELHNERDAKRMSQMRDFWSGKRMLITAGPTYEKIDDVRFIGNYSSGKMGFAIARQAARLGMNVCLIAGPVALETPRGVERINVESAQEMHEKAMTYFPGSHVGVFAAAVADFTPTERVKGKIKKETMQTDVMTLQLHRTSDILASAGSRKSPKQTVVGFALESSSPIENGTRKLHKKNADMIVLNEANRPQSGFQGDNNTITILRHDLSPQSFPTMTKEDCALVILEAAMKVSSMKLDET